MNEQIAELAPGVATGGGQPGVVCVADLAFRLGGNATNHLGAGWSAPEAGFIWTVGLVSEVFLPAPTKVAGEKLYLTLYASGFMLGENARPQRLRVLANGHEVLAAEMTGLSTVAGCIPDAAWQGTDVITLTLEHPDAVQVNTVIQAEDDRLLAISMVSLRLDRVTPDGTVTAPRPQVSIHDLPDDRLLLAFESLGDNCEFGIVQRRNRAEPIGLLRFSAVPVDVLFDLLRSRFADIANRAHIGVEAVRLDNGDEEFLVHHRRFRLTYHTFTFSSQTNAERVIGREVARLTFATRALMEHLQEASRIFVYKSSPELSDAMLVALFTELRAYGPVTLLYVTPVRPQRPAGTVETLLPGLMRGYVSRYAPYDNAAGGDDASWITMCRTAHRLWTDVA